LKNRTGPQDLEASQILPSAQQTPGKHRQPGYRGQGSGLRNILNKASRIAWGLGWLVLVFVLGLLYYDAAVRHLTYINTDMQQWDQSAYMWAAYEMRVDRSSCVTDRCRMPLYPWLQSLFFRMDLGWSEASFVRGKYVNIVLSMVLLAALFFILNYWIPYYHALALVLTLAFTVFVFKAAYFHDSLLFYFINFLAFLLMLRMFVRPSPMTAALCGLFSALAYLTKASALLAVAIFAFFFIVKQLSAFRRAVCRSDGLVPFVNGALRRLGCLAVAAIVFAAVIFPYISTSKERFGRYFYNVNSTFYMWYDSWEQVKNGTKAHGDRKAWPKMPPEKLPSLAKYWSEHSIAHMALRLGIGVAVLGYEAITSYGWFKYCLIYGLLAWAAALRAPDYAVGILKKHIAVFVFAVFYFLIYMASYSWYQPIGSGVRFPLAHFLPFLFICALIIVKTDPYGSPLKILGMPVRFQALAAALILTLVLAEAPLICTERIVSMSAGN
jgi:hypothetical protein